MLLGNLEIRCLTPNRTNLVFSGLIKRWSRIRDLKNDGYNVDENNFVAEAVKITVNLDL